MAYIDPSQDPNQDPNNDQSQVAKASGGTQSQSQTSDQSSEAPPTTGGGGAGGVVSAGSGASAGGSTPSTPKPSTSGSWTNLNSYLDANQGQGDQTAATLANTINTQGQTAQNETSTLANNFGSAVNASTVNADPNAVSTALNNADNIQAGTNLSQSDMDAFSKQANASYSGPTDMTQDANYAQTQNDVNNAVTSANQTTSEAGRDVLLQNQYNNASANGYNQGENNLDQMLLENSAGGQSLAQLAPQWNGLNTVLSNNVASGNAQAAQAAQTTAATQAAALSAFNTNRNAQLASVQSALGNEQTQWGQNAQALQSTLNGYTGGTLNLTAAQAQQLGLTNQESIYDLAKTGSLGQYVQSNTFDPNAAITANQQAQLAALDQLGSSAGQTALNPYTNAALAGTQTAANSIDTSQLQKQLGLAQAQYNDSYNASNQNVLNQSLSNDGLGYILAPGVGSSSGLDTASAAQLQNYWLPLFAQAAQQSYGTYDGSALGKSGHQIDNNIQQTDYQGIRQSLADWEQAHGANNMVNVNG